MGRALGWVAGALGELGHVLPPHAEPLSISPHPSRQMGSSPSQGLSFCGCLAPPAPYKGGGGQWAGATAALGARCLAWPTTAGVALSYPTARVPLLPRTGRLCPPSSAVSLESGALLALGPALQLTSPASAWPRGSALNAQLMPLSRNWGPREVGPSDALRAASLLGRRPHPQAGPGQTPLGNAGSGCLGADQGPSPREDREQRPWTHRLRGARAARLRAAPARRGRGSAIVKGRAGPCRGACWGGLAGDAGSLATGGPGDNPCW